ncbi:DNA topoisomerase 2 [Hibiscus syriacus]|uniref:DNA topoisomerase 2 n=1 Tax=Hibiscus syriacus TaxID=106335 RepID=A0A6A2X6L3_HIBSY|nr:DNA topoisomerase 2-like [Hibiscus syriacus]KAE8670742.1 DNA topoisomerase 2 [Hibiscus syriacus]
MVTDSNLPLQSGNNANIKASKTIEETYQKKTQLEHILLRPDTYIGSIEQHAQKLWVYENDEMIHREIKYVPGLYKIFDEILVNAADNKQRDPTMDSLKVVIDAEQNLISVYNNGDGVPVEIHQEEKVYVPELIFGHLLTSSNYDDNVKKTTGGRNGYGAKLTNIFSTEFVIETADGKRKKKYKQVFRNNMGSKTEPFITKCKEGENWTKVTFKPDLAKFNMTHLEEDVVALMRKRVFDLAGCLGKTVKVELNGKRIPVKSFLDYVNLYLSAASKTRTETLPRIPEKVNARWEVCVSISEGQFQQVSFVNGISTIKGGTHVDYVTNQISNYVMNAINKKNKNANIKAHNVKNHLWVFVNALIDNPAFDSQTKETLTLRQSSFGSKCELSEDFLKKVAKSGIVDSLLQWAEFKHNKDLKKTDGTKSGSIRGIPKLDDANDAGGRNSEKCTLILTEGDSAKSLALAGLSVVGRNHYGVYPLRGKLLNVREASHKQLMENAEIQNLKRILGLQQNKEYTDVKSLRYGHLMIMTDQDHDGSHIKGLLINFIHSFWPSLLKVKSFMVEFITPIVKASRMVNKKKEEIPFYSMPEYQAWKESLGGNTKGWTIKYYKGLGTSTAAEGKDYFKEINKHKKEFVWEGDQDGDSIELAFSKKKIEARKNWLRHFEPGTHLDHNEKLVNYSDFINKELILFSIADLQRSIPSMVDGLKPGQRKILFCAFKRNFVKEAKVSQFSGYVSEHSAYHHGEQSLMSTIIGMAQDFVGSNNINVLRPNGQFGTRNQGGKDAASARYIFTSLSPITRYLFPKEDDGLLDYLNEDGQSIEPSWYVPIIPMVLVNGSEGIGTGWSSFIPNYNPRDIVANVRRLLNDEQMEPMHPWYRGFKGTIEQTASKESGVTYTITGEIEEVNETTLKIKELPIRRWTQDYKEFLESVITSNDSFIKEFKQFSDDKTVDFEIIMTMENMMLAKQDGLLKKFKLTTMVSTSNMHLFDSRGVIKKYDNPEEILEEFFHLRLEFYVKRRKHVLDTLELELLKMDNKVRFILDVVKGDIIVNNRKRADLFLELKEKGFTPFPKKKKVVEIAVAGDIDGEEPEDNFEASAAAIESDYDYLLSMAIGTLTLEKVRELIADKDKLQHEVEYWRKSTPKTLWLNDLDELEKQLDEQDKADREAEEQHGQDRAKNGAGKKAAGRQATKNTRKPTKKDQAVTETSDFSLSSMETENVPAAVVKPKGRAGAKKATKADSDDDDGDFDIPDLRERLAKHNIDSSPDHSANMETEVAQEPAGKKEPSKRAPAGKKNPTISLTEISESIGEINISDEDVEVASPAKKGGRKPASNSKAGKPPAAAARKRGPAAAKQQQQKLLTQMLKPTASVTESSGISPEKKVRKMRASPFNKKSGSVLGKAKGSSSLPSMEEIDSDEEDEEVAVVVEPRARPQRANRTKTTYIVSDSETEEDNAAEDSDFEEQ